MKHTIENKTASEISKLIDEHIVGRMAYRNRDVMKDHFIDGFTYEWIAEKYDMSIQQVKNICYKGLNKIADFI